MRRSTLSASSDWINHPALRRCRISHENQNPGRADGPAALDERARPAAAEKISEIGRQKRYPEREQAVLQCEAARHEINGEPVRDEEPDRIGQRLADDDAPGLRQTENGFVRQ